MVSHWAGAIFDSNLPSELGEVEVGPDAFERAAVEVGHVHGIADFAGDEEVPHLIGHFDADVFLGFGGGRAEVRGEHAFFHGQQREIRGRRLGFVDIERDAGQMAGVEQGLGGGFIDQSAAGAVDDQRAGVHQAQACLVEDVVGFRRERDVQGDHIRAGERLLGALGELDLERLGAGRGEERIVGDHGHAEGLGALGELACRCGPCRGWRGVCR